MVSKMEKESTIMLMEIPMMVNGYMIKFMDFE